MIQDSNKILLHYGYLTYKGIVLVPTNVQQRTRTAIERKGQTVGTWSSMFYVGILFRYFFKIKMSVEYIHCIKATMYLSLDDYNN